MDNLKFGGFLAQCRKEKGWTQKDLAEQLHVTDKAVSKWERGLGFPDIKLIEPLAEVLEVSILELMRGERVDEEERPADSGPEVAAGMVDLATHRQKLERRNTAIAAISVIACLLLVFLLAEIGHFDLLEFVFTYLWIICLVVSALMMFLCYLRYRRKLPWKLLLACSFMVAALPILIVFLLLLVVYIGLIFS